MKNHYILITFIIVCVVLGELIIVLNETCITKAEIRAVQKKQIVMEQKIDSLIKLIQSPIPKKESGINKEK